MKRLLILLAALAALAGCSSDGGSCGASTPASCPSTTPSYATDVAPLMAKYCTSCHIAGGQESDKPLDSHAALSGQSGDVQGQIAGCDMPPSGSTQPTDAERNTILAWIVCGAPDN